MGLGKAATAYVDGGVPGNKDFNTFQELEVWKVKQLCFALLFFPGIFSFFSQFCCLEIASIFCFSEQRGSFVQRQFVNAIAQQAVHQARSGKKRYGRIRFPQNNILHIHINIYIL